MTKIIALVDDDRNILTSVSIALENEGYKVQTYVDGESAYIGITRTPPDLAIIDKRRAAHNIAESLTVIGEVKGKTAILIDDMIDTGGTICSGAHLLKKEGAKLSLIHI